jgi:hypothetical protein
MRAGHLTSYYNARKEPRKIVYAINDGLGIAVACFARPWQPGQIANRGVYKNAKMDTSAQDSRFRIIREVPIEEVRLLQKTLGEKNRLETGWWYEVIGD